MSGNRSEEDGIDIVFAPSLHKDLSVSSRNFSLELGGIDCSESADVLLPSTYGQQNDEGYSRSSP
jgi:hypothetical protein